jgi:hypothetical protein
MPFSRAATRKKTLNEEPGWKPLPPRAVARSTWDRLKFSRPPYSARIRPVLGSTLARAPVGLPFLPNRVHSWFWTAALAWAWRLGSRVV